MIGRATPDGGPSRHELPGRIGHLCTLAGYAAGIIAFLLACSRLDLHPGALLRSLTTFLVVFLPAGSLLTRRIGVGLLPPWERLTLAMATGYVASSAGYYVLNLGGLGSVFPPAILFLLVLCLYVERRSLAALAGMIRNGNLLSGGLAPPGMFVALIGLIILVTTRGNAAFAPSHGGLTYYHTSDHLFHLSVYWELLRGIPPAELPFMAGVPFPSYHVMAYMPGVFLARFASIDPTSITHAVIPMTTLALLAGLLHTAVRVRTGSQSISAATLVAVFFVYATLDNWRFVQEAGMVPLEYFMRSVSGGGGIIVWGLILCLLVIADRERTSPAGNHPWTLPLIATLVGVSFLFKAQFYVLFASAFLATMAVVFLRERSVRPVLAAAIVLGVTAALYLSWRSGQNLSGLSWAPGVYASENVLPMLRRSPGPLLSRWVPGALEAVPWHLGWVATTFFGIWHLFTFTVFSPVYLARCARRARSLGLTDLFICLVLVLATGMALFTSDQLMGGDTGQFFRQAMIPLRIVIMAVDVVCLGHLLGRMKKLPASAALLAVTGLALLLSPLTCRMATHRSVLSLTLTPELQGALAYLREKTPPEAVVLDNVINIRTRKRIRRSPASNRISLPPTVAPMKVSSPNRAPIVSAFGGRRAVLGYYRSSDFLESGRNRGPEVRAVFSSPNPQVVGKILLRYGVDYVLSKGGPAPAFPGDSAQLVYRKGTVRLWRVNPRTIPG